jgi:hypothetical protein
MWGGPILVSNRGSILASAEAILGEGEEDRFADILTFGHLFI